jgi:uncharacterized membrane protein YqaE (UPF0057 family)
VLTEKERIDRDFFINCILTLIGWLPGVVHAMWIILRY